jgi:hypothetical protein
VTRYSTEPHPFKIGDLVYLKYDRKRVIGLGLVLNTYDSYNHTCLVHWFLDDHVQVEYAINLELAKNKEECDEGGKSGR